AGREAELAQLRSQLTQSEADAIQARQELAQLEEAVAGQQASVDGAEGELRSARERLAEQEREREEANGVLVEILTTVARKEDRAAAVADRRAEIDQRLRASDRDYEEKQSAASAAGQEQTDLEEGLRNLLGDRDRFQEQLIEAMRNQDRTAEQLRLSAESLRGAREKYEGRRARLDSLREILEQNEDAGAGTRHLMAQGEQAHTRFGLRGFVRELLDIEREAEKAVAAVLSERADALVVADAGGVVDALGSLREQSGGRGVFLVEPAHSDPAPGIVPLGQPLLNWVRPLPGHEPLAHRLLGDVYVVDSLGEALTRYGSGALPATFVTLDGDVATPDGIVSGGGEARGTGSLSRMREMRGLEHEVQGLADEVQQLESAHSAAEAAHLGAIQELENLRNRHHTAALAVANHEKDLERTAERVKTLGEAQEFRVAERADLVAESDALSAEQVELDSRLGGLREDRGSRQSELDALGLRIGSASREVSRVETRLAELRVAHAARVETRDRLSETVSRADASTRETAEWITRREQEIEAGIARRAELVASSASAQSSLAEQVVAEEAARVQSDSLRDAYERQAADVREIDEAVRTLRRDVSGRQEESTAAELSLRESEMRLSHQVESIRERWNVDIENWELPPLEPADLQEESEPPSAPDPAAAAEAAVAARLAGQEEVEAAETAPELTSGEAASERREARRNAELARADRTVRERELETLRKSLQSMGEVNLGAIEEHEELAERFRFLSEQRGDLQETIDSLREAITRINRTSRRRFRETFDAVSKRFSENFPRLFGGGKASLTLTDSEDILEAGIDIMAMPPGKRLQNVNLLSGGEKTMTALALLIAVFQVRPSPFFLLDEVDAALDDANVGRFNQLIVEMAAHSQFLVITHNKRTIEVADVLYGVTMEQKGVSKLVGVELT
ncbi:hypothetical protein MK280_02155, partial [Myxococcota bacterium]|nr:hypothetical protein [Myxococcota bacterium]